MSYFCTVIHYFNLLNFKHNFLHSYYLLYLNLHEIDQGVAVTGRKAVKPHTEKIICTCIRVKRAFMHSYMSAAAVSDSAEVRAGVRRCGHDPIVGGKSGAKLGNK